MTYPVCSGSENQSGLTSGDFLARFAACRFRWKVPQAPLVIVTPNRCVRWRCGYHCYRCGCRYSCCSCYCCYSCFFADVIIAMRFIIKTKLLILGHKVEIIKHQLILDEHTNLLMRFPGFTGFVTSFMNAITKPS